MGGARPGIGESQRTSLWSPAQAAAAGNQALELLLRPQFQPPAPATEYRLCPRVAVNVHHSELLLMPDELILELGPYIEDLKKTHGAISEFGNPKFKEYWLLDLTKTTTAARTELRCPSSWLPLPASQLPATGY